MYTPVSVPKIGTNPGRPRGKEPNTIIIRTQDILTYPERDENGVKSEIGENIVLKPGAKAISIYMTPSTIKRFDTGEGDPDAKGWIQNVEGWHPGNDAALEEWKENNISENLVCLTFRHGFTDVRLSGTMEEPLQFEVEEQDDMEKIGTTIRLKSVMRGPKAMIYLGAKPVLDTDSGSGGAGV